MQFVFDWEICTTIFYKESEKGVLYFFRKERDGGDEVEEWLLQLMEQFGYLGIFALIALENVFPPIPSEVILTFGGFMTQQTELSKTGVVLAATGGSLCGALILFAVGKWLDVKRMEALIDRYGHVLRLTKEDIQKADRWFDRYGPWTVLFCRLIPLIRSLISIPAGMSGMNIWLFICLTALGTAVWNTILVHLGASVGENWHDIVEAMSVFSDVVYVGIAMIGIAILIWYIRLRKKRK